MSSTSGIARSYDCGRAWYADGGGTGYCFCDGCKRLHDAAPGLLLALKDLRHAFNNPDPIVRRDAREAADAAIAEAEGRDA